MFWIRSLVFGLPAILVSLFIASFISVRVVPPKVKNQIVSASIGEPKTLNPIQAADASASEVMDLVFEGLLSMNENLETIGRIAEKWELSQTSTVFFGNPAQAENAARKLEALSGKWPGWGLTKTEVIADQMLLFLKEPGTRKSAEVVAALNQSFLKRTAVIRVELESSAQASMTHFLEHARTASQVRRRWVEGAGAYELTVVSPAEDVAREIEGYYAANKDLKAKVEVKEEGTHLDEPVVLFHLNRNVRWHDGTSLTSRDAAFTYRAIMDEKYLSPRKPDYDVVLAVETPDPYQFRVIYRKPYSPALNSWMIGLLPAHILEGKDSAWWAANFNRQPIGCGPFIFKKWKTNEFIELEKNLNYFRGAPHLDSWVFRPIPDPTSIRLAFETKQTDSWLVEPYAVGKFNDDPRYDLFSGPGAGYTYVGWNLQRPIFQDKKVRQALAQAVDIPAIIQYVLYGHGQQATGIWDPKMWWFDESVKPFIYDPEKARALLAEAGWKPGADGILEKDGQKFSFVLITNNANEVRKDIATLVQASLIKVGIKVEVQLYEWAVFLKQFIDKRDFDACVLGWSLGPDYDQYQIWHSSQTGPEKLNTVSYKNPKVDKLLEQIRAEYDKDEIKRIASELQRTIYDDQPYLFLYIPSSTSVMWKNTLRVSRPEDGKWIDEPIRMTKAGAGVYREYFYRPEYAPFLKP